MAVANAAGVGRNAEVASAARNGAMTPTLRPVTRMPCSTERERAWRAKLCFIGHALMENRHGLLIDTRLTRVSGHAERLAALV